MQSCVIDSPLGSLELMASERGLQAIRFVDKSPSKTSIPPVLEKAVTQLREYFAGVREHFELTLDFSSLPQFQASVLKLVRTIPYGRTRSYEQIAICLGNPKASRAVGQANGNNPLPIVIPCHRVIGKKGNLTGYAFGLTIKEKLLKLENPKRYQEQMQLFAS